MEMMLLTLVVNIIFKKKWKRRGRRKRGRKHFFWKIGRIEKKE